MNFWPARIKLLIVKKGLNFKLKFKKAQSYSYWKVSFSTLSDIVKLIAVRKETFIRTKFLPVRIKHLE